MHGKGIYKWVDGRFYSGEYVNDKKHGKGAYRWADNRVYIGTWADGRQEGEGHIVMPTGTVKKVNFA